MSARSCIRVGCDWCGEYADVLDLATAAEWEKAHVASNPNHPVSSEYYPFPPVMPWTPD